MRRNRGLPRGVSMDPDDVLYKDGLPIGRVIETPPGLGLWMALAKTRSYGSMDEVAKALPSKDAAIHAALEHSRAYWA